MSFLTEISWREKNLWVELLTDIVVAAYYFPKLLGLMAFGDDALMGAAMGVLVFKTVVVGIICAIAMNIVLYLLKLRQAPEKQDERDSQFSAKGYIGAYWMLAICIGGLMGQIILGEIFAEWDWGLVVLSPVIIAHLLLIALILSSTTKSLIQLYLYRRGY